METKKKIAVPNGVLRSLATRILVIACVITAAGCARSELQEPNAAASVPEKLLAEGKKQLSAGNFEDAFDTFSDLSLHPDYICESDYGVYLSKLLEAIQLLDPLVQVLGIVQGTDTIGGGIPIARDYGTVFFEVFVPLEASFSRMRVHMERILASNCTFNLPQGFPVVIGRDESELRFSAVLGDEWDDVAVRLSLAIVDATQAFIDYLFAHRFEIQEETIEQAVNILESLVASQSSDSSTTTTLIDVGRAAGVLMDWNPFLLEFSINADDRARIFQVDDDLESMARAIYTRDVDGIESGLIPSMIERNVTDPDLLNNVISVVDNGDGEFGVGDTIHLGIQTATIGSVFPPDPDNPGVRPPPVSLFDTTINGGVEIQLRAGLGNVAEATRLAHEIILNIGDQMAAVDNPEQSWQRLGVEEINGIVFNLEPLATNFPQFPEAIELDLRAFFLNPVPARELLPYWYDDDDDFQTPDVFVIEGESSQGINRNYVVDSDSAHFPESFVFDDITGLVPVIKTDQSIDQDQVFPNDLIRLPVPYVLWQDPTFHSVLYVDSSQLPVAASGQFGFRLTDQKLTNKTLASFLVWYTNETDTVIE